MGSFLSRSMKVINLIISKQGNRHVFFPSRKHTWTKYTAPRDSCHSDSLVLYNVEDPSGGSPQSWLSWYLMAAVSALLLSFIMGVRCGMWWNAPNASESLNDQDELTDEASEQLCASAPTMKWLHKVVESNFRYTIMKSPSEEGAQRGEPLSTASLRTEWK